jgi:cell division protein ZapA
VKQLEVSIMGQTYILACPAGHETSLLEAVGNVDREMSAIRDAGKVRARERIAVLAALNLAYELSQHTAGAPVPGATAAAPPASHGIDVEGLVRRVDAALGSDGQLL